MRNLVLLLPVLAAAFLAVPAPAQEPARSESTPLVTVTRSPTCGCCAKWGEHLEANGFRVQMRNVADLKPIKREKGVPAPLASCHTGEVEGYVIEGHVPAADVRRLLEQRPDVAGLAVPGMPEGSPGMEGPDPEPYHVYAFDREGRVSVFSTHGP